MPACHAGGRWFESCTHRKWREEMSDNDAARRQSLILFFCHVLELHAPLPPFFYPPPHAHGRNRTKNHRFRPKTLKNGRNLAKNSRFRPKTLKNGRNLIKNRRFRPTPRGSHSSPPKVPPRAITPTWCKHRSLSTTCLPRQALNQQTPMSDRLHRYSNGPEFTRPLWWRGAPRPRCRRGRAAGPARRR